jgi:hypothetical protein
MIRIPHRTKPGPAGRSVPRPRIAVEAAGEKSGNSRSFSATTRRKGDKRWTILTASTGSHETEAAGAWVSSSPSSAALARLGMMLHEEGWWAMSRERFQFRECTYFLGMAHHVEEFLYLQKLVQGRVGLTPTTLSMAHRVQLEILVAIKTGIQAFLHPSVNISQSRLAEVFFYKRCRNIACQSALPAEECRCNICTSRTGFCNLCMCVICNKFVFEVNTCRWIGCDACSHWTHADCAIRDGQIGTACTIKNGIGHTEMLFRCQACRRTSELLGWVRDIFQQCAPGWDRDALIRELDYVCKISRLSEDSKGRNLFRKCAELVERLRNASVESMSPRMLLQALQGTSTFLTELK